jgi:hypothetical protein
MFENGMVRGIFGSKTDEVMKGWAGHTARTLAKRNAYRVWAGKPEGKRPLGRPKRRWVDNIKMNVTTHNVVK